VEVAPAHLDHPFDYRVPDGLSVSLGQRVRVPFAGSTRAGWVIGDAPPGDTAVEGLRSIAGTDGPWSWFDETALQVLRWVAWRYAAPLAAVLRHCVPGRVAGVDREAEGWESPAPPAPAVRPPCPASAWRPYNASALLKAVAGSGSSEPATRAGQIFWWRPLVGDDRAAMSGDLVSRCLSSGRSAVVLSADPNAAVARMALAVAGSLGADLRGEPALRSRSRARYRAALRCLLGHARVAVGGRGAVFAPVRDLGLVIVDDEANPTYKERRSPRHHAREVALARARAAGAVTVLVADLPSAALWRLHAGGHCAVITGDRLTERRRAPRVDVVDLASPRPGARRTRLGPVAAQAVEGAVAAGTAAVVLVARRGEGTALACRTCGRRRACPTCDGAVRADVPDAPEWTCATCGWSGSAFACLSCGSRDTAPLAAGAGRLSAELRRSHPAAAVARMEGFDAEGPTTRPAVAVMTRGSVVGRPAWLGDEQADVVVVPDADALLGRSRFDAGEDALRLWLSAGGWARRIVLQTREPSAPAVQALVRWDPEGFWRDEAERRAELGWPPHAWLLRLDAGGADPSPAQAAVAVATQVRAALAADVVLGPDIDGVLIVKTRDLRGTLDALIPLRHAWGRRGTSVRVDVDPVET